MTRSMSNDDSNQSATATLGTRLQMSGLRLACRGAAALSLPAQQRWGRNLGWIAGRLLRVRRRAVLEVLARCFPEKPEPERRAIADGMYRHLGRMAMECLAFSARPLDDFASLVDAHGAEHARAALARGRGMLALMGHIGNWELQGIAAARSLRTPINVVVRNQHNEAFDQFWRESRQRMGLNVLPPRHAYRDCLRALRRGEIVAIILDQNMRRRNGIFVDFFGRSACTTPGLAYMAAQSQAPVVPVYCHRISDGRHALHFGPALDPPADREDATIHAATQRYTAILEEIIRRHPDQWLWLHKRWRTRPEQPIPPARRASVQMPDSPR